MTASEWGSDDWWLVVQSSPLLEARQMLDDYKATLLADTTQEAMKNNYKIYVAAGIKVQRVNSELKSINRRLIESSWQRACAEVLDEDTYAAVRIRKAELETEKETP